MVGKGSIKFLIVILKCDISGCIKQSLLCPVSPLQRYFWRMKKRCENVAVWPSTSSDLCMVCSWHYSHMTEECTVCLLSFAENTSSCKKKYIYNNVSLKILKTMLTVYISVWLRACLHTFTVEWRSIVFFIWVRMRALLVHEAKPLKVTSVHS